VCAWDLVIVEFILLVVLCICVFLFIFFFGLVWVGVCFSWFGLGVILEFFYWWSGFAVLLYGVSSWLDSGWGCEDWFSCWGTFFLGVVLL